MTDQNLKIGIIGDGIVGRAIKQYYKDAKICGKFDANEQAYLEVLKQDIIFIVVPTPFDNQKQQIDLSAVEETFRIISARCVNFGQIFVLKSTVIPGTTQKIKERYGHLNIIFNPEFLTSKYAPEDFAYPDKQIVGATWDGKSWNFDDCQKIMEILPPARDLICTSIEAEMIKYTLNTFFCARVIFANQIYDVCQKLGINYEMIIKGVSYDKRVNISHFSVMQDGYRGYGDDARSKCFPKDIKAFINFADSIGVNLKLHKICEKINNELLKNETKN